MNDRFHLEAATTLSEIRAYLRDLQAGGLTEVNLPDVETAEASCQTLDSIQKEIETCERCALCQPGKQIPGHGTSSARLVVVTLTPTRVDLQHHQILSGDSGRLYDAQLKAIGLTRDQIWTTSLVKCPLRGDPAPSKVAACRPHIENELAVIQPARILVLGEHAGRCLLGHAASDPLRGRWHQLGQIPLRVSYHPLELLRNPELKREAWEDLRTLMRVDPAEIKRQLLQN